MRLHKGDRILIGIAGLLVLMICGGIVAEAVFQVPVSSYIAEATRAQNTWIRVALGLLSLALMALAVWCFSMVLRKSRVNRGFVRQDSDDGATEISVEAMDSLVRTCLALHPEMKVVSTGVESGGDHVNVDIRVTLAEGVSVPLAVSALQKQVSSYINECTGIEVREVHVQVERLNDPRTETVYNVPELLAAPQAKLEKAARADRGEEEQQAAHQRIFGQAEEPMTVPVPPELDTQPEKAEAPAETEPAGDAAEVTEEAAELTEQPESDPAEEPETRDEPDAGIGDEPAEAAAPPDEPKAQDDVTEEGVSADGT